MSNQTATRQPFTEPFTIRERLAIQAEFRRGEWEVLRAGGGWDWIADRLPRRLVAAAFRRVMHDSWVKSTKGIDEITCVEASERWEGTWTP